ncbi:MAG: hypothetical protein WCZ12_03105 [Patescibacteria group bacterium]
MAEQIKEQANDRNELPDVLQESLQEKIKENIDEDAIKKQLELEKQKVVKKDKLPEIKNISNNSPTALQSSPENKSDVSQTVNKEQPKVRNIEEELGIADDLEKEKIKDRRKTGAEHSIKAIEPLPIESPRQKTEDNKKEEGGENEAEGKNSGKEDKPSEDEVKKKGKSDEPAKEELKGAAKGDSAGGAEMGSRMALDQLLKSAWINIFTTFTLSMFWVYIHVFLGMIFPKFFCKLGQEWVPKNIKMAAPDQADKIARRIGIAEKGLTGCCCFFHVILILVAFIMILLTPPISLIVGTVIVWDWISSLFSS